MVSTNMTWQAKVATKRAKLAASLPASTVLPGALLDSLTPTSAVLDVPATSGVLTARQLAVTEEASPAALLGKLAAGVYSAAEVCRAFCDRAAVAQQLIGCLTETLFDRAEAKAAELDKHLKETGQLAGPLHGSVVAGLAG